MKSDAIQSILLHYSEGLFVRGVDCKFDETADWSVFLKPGMRHIVLNLSGHGVVLGKQIRLSIIPRTVSLLRTELEEKVHASRLVSDERHRFVIFSVSPSWLVANFGEAQVALHPVLWDDASLGIGYLRSMNLAERDLCVSLLQPPVMRALRLAWFQGKALECFSLFGSAPGAGISDHSPLHQRVDAATIWLREHFRESLDLDAVAKHVGCAPHYLSRLFKSHTGKTLSLKLREIRIDHAANLLKNGTNVTEAAFEVGYNSLSHFTKAFFIEKGTRPSDWRAG